MATWAPRAAGTGLDNDRGMSPTKIMFAVALGASAALLGSPVRAAGPSLQCDDQLVDLGSMQAALAQMEEAVAANKAHRERLRTEASALAATIADRLRDGASSLEVEPLAEQRGAALRELDQAESIGPALEGQLEALVLQLDHAERGYIACIESTLD